MAEWFEFALSVGWGVLFLFLPGALVAYVLCRNRILSIACGPVASVAMYFIASTIYGLLGIPMSWALLFFPVLVAAAAVFAIAMLARAGKKSKGKHERGKRDDKVEKKSLATTWLANDWVQLSAYVLLGAFFTWFLFLRNIPSPDAFTTGIDNLTHLGVIQAFMETGNWSFFGISVYGGETFTPPSGSTAHGFYPSAWHVVAAMIASVSDIEATTAVNACNAVFLAFVFPTGILSMMRALFPEKPLIVCFGALACVGFPSMPWKLLSAGPVYPNMAALCLAPSAISLFVSFTAFAKLGRRRVGLLVLFCVALVALVLTQTNVIFTIMVFLAPYCVYLIVKWPFFNRLSHPKLFKSLGCLLFVVAFAAVWVFLYNLPALSSIVNFEWPSYQSVPRALFSFLTLSYWLIAKQASMAVLVFVGFIWALRKCETRWLSASYVLIGILYVTTSATEGPIKHLLTGFWYTDPMRISAAAAFFAMPLAALGLSAICDIVWKVLSKNGTARNAKYGKLAVGAGLAVLLLAALIIPNRFYIGKPGNPSPLEWISMGTEIDYGMGPETAYDLPEAEFVERAKQVIGDDALVINEPVDGSVFAYGVNDLNTYYRFYTDYADTEVADTIRLRLKDIATDDSVRSAVDGLGAQYVLQLDRPSGDERLTTLSPFSERTIWPGIEGVNDDTPGFELVMAEDDMRLYRILSKDETMAQAGIE